MPNRSYTAGTQFRYGFNGKENDNDVKGTGNQQDYGMRIYDTRIGKFLSVDPLFEQYPWYTPYQFAGNSPICNTDIDGEEEKWYLLTVDAKTGKTQLTLIKEEKEVSILWGLFTYKHDFVVTHVQFNNQNYTFNLEGHEPGSPFIQKMFDEFVEDPEGAIERYPNCLTSDEQEFREFATQTGAVVAFGAIGTYKSFGKVKSVTTPKSQQQSEPEPQAQVQQAKPAGQQKVATNVKTSSNSESTTKVNTGVTDPVKNRVKLRKSTIEKIKENQPRNSKGQMIDPNTKKTLKKDQIDIGHKPGQEWRKRQQMHRRRNSTRKEVIEAENDPDLYQLEDRKSNQSHKYEQKKTL